MGRKGRVRGTKRGIARVGVKKESNNDLKERKMEIKVT